MITATSSGILLNMKALKMYLQIWNRIGGYEIEIGNIVSPPAENIIVFVFSLPRLTRDLKMLVGKELQLSTQDRQQNTIIQLSISISDTV